MVAQNKAATKDTKTAKESKGRPTFKAPAGVTYPYAKTPAGFEFARFRPLKKKDFTGDASFLTYRAEELEFKAAAMRQKAEMAAQFGDKSELGKAKRLIKMQQRMEDLSKELAAEGMDVAKLLERAKSLITKKSA